MIWIVRYVIVLLLTALFAVTWYGLGSGPYCIYDVLDDYYLRPLPCIDFVGGFR